MRVSSASAATFITFFLLQGERDLERLKHKLEQLQHAPRSHDGTFRTAAEAEWQRKQLAAEAADEHWEVDKALREQGAKLQSLYDTHHRTEYELAKRCAQITTKQLCTKLLERISSSSSIIPFFAW
jgi:hypothetical protein